MIKDGRDTEYNKLRYYPHYWIKTITDSRDGTTSGYVLMRTTNLKDTTMKDKHGLSINSGSYYYLYELAKKLNSRNQERGK